ncbi:MAG: 6-pyruvoyl tetrahydropterin synthase family protein [Pseudobdellovibrionaceae bacterium]
MIVSREIAFRAFHSHKGMLSEPFHQHEYRAVIGIEGSPNEEGFVCDFRAVKRTFNRVVAQRLEGANLDEVFEYPTAENLAVWIWNAMTTYYPLHSVEVYEKPHSRAVYFGPRP